MKKGIGVANKVMLAFAIFIIIPIFIIGLMFYNNSRLVMQEQLMNANLKNLENFKDYYMAPYINSMNQLMGTWTEERDLGQITSNRAIREKYDNQWTNLLRTTPDLTSIYVGTQKGDLFSTPPDPLLPKDYDPRTRPWYKMATAMDGVMVWTQPYRDAGSKGMVLSLAKQVYDEDGKAVGVLSADLKLTKMLNILSNVKFGKSGYVVVLDADGNAISIPDEKLLGQNLKSLDWVKQAYLARSGSTFFKIKDTEVVLSYLTVSETGWKLIAVMPKAEMVHEFAGVDNYAVKLLIFMGVWLLLACICLILYFRSLLYHPIKSIMLQMEAAAKGDLSFELNGRYKDEIGQLYRSFCNMVKGQKEIVEQMHQTADDLSRSSELVSTLSGETHQTAQNQSHAMSELTQAIEDMSISVNDVTMNISSIASNIKGVAHSMQELGIAADEVAKSTVETAEAMSDVIHSVADMEASTVLISHNTGSANAQGEKSIQIVGNGKRIIDSTISEMENINQAMQELSWVINDLGKAAAQIGDIVEVIEDISEQTNLLSLNASIEAARAGEHGKGFAVVAAAIGRLSEKSSESTKDIEKLIKQIQGIVEDAVKTTTKSADCIENGVALVTETEGAFNTIREAIEETTRLINQISLSTYEQKEASKIIINATSRVNELTMHVSAASEQQLATIEEIIRATEIANELTQGVVSSAQVQAANSQEIAATALTVNEMTGAVTTKSDEVLGIAHELEEHAQGLMEVVGQFKVQS